jgi:hypothetical protein
MTSNGFSTSLNPLQNSEIVCLDGVWVEQAAPLTCANFPICSCPLPVAPIPVPEIRDASVEDAAVEAAITDALAADALILGTL